MKKWNINKLTYLINGAIFEVNRLLGNGFLEKVYENALLIELRKRELDCQGQVPIQVTYKGVAVGEYFADIVVNNQVILELKAEGCSISAKNPRSSDLELSESKRLQSRNACKFHISKSRN